MKFLRSWLEEYIDLTGVTTQELAHSITTHSSEVESVEHITDYFNHKVVVGKIINSRQHPDADRLKIFDVQIGNDATTQIVSAAPNVQDGLLVPVALIGATLPGLTISERPMRGAVSNGMCCGKSELMLEREFSSGLWELDCDDSHIGESICAVYPNLFPAEDLLEIKILPDRIGNIGNYIGLALEVAHALGKPELLKGVAAQIQAGNFGYARTDINQDNELTLRFSDSTGLSQVFDVFRGKLNTPYTLPLDIKKKLHLIGANLVNPLADLSNYCMHSTGQPVHFFSTKKVYNNSTSTSWQLAETSEPTPFVGLGNLKSTTLPAGVIVLKDTNSILAIPALTGGESTKVTEDDTDIMIEIPTFNDALTMRNSFRTKYRSEGAKIWASRSHPSRGLIALSLLQRELPADYSILCLSENGVQTQEPLSAHSAKFAQPTTITVDWDYIASRLDKSSADRVQTLLTPHLALLGTVSDNQLTIPHLGYNFITDQDSLLTELSYLNGVNDIQATGLKTHQIPPYSNPDADILLEFKNRLAGLGFTEIITRPFVQQGSIEVLKPQNENMNYLRTNLWETLLKVAGDNYNAGVGSLRFFEINKLYSKNSGLQETRELCAALSSEDPYEATTIINTIASWNNLVITNAEITQSVTDRGNETHYSWNNFSIKLIEVNNAQKKLANLPNKKKIWLIESDLTTLHHLANTNQYTDVAPFPSTERDYNIALGKDALWSTIRQALKAIPTVLTYTFLPADRAHIQGQEILTVRFVLTHPERTITSQDITEFETALALSLQPIVNVELRTYA